MGSTAKNAAADRSMRRAAVSAIALVLLAPLVASCSSTEEAGSDPTTTTAATADAASTDPAADGATTTTGAPALSDPASDADGGLPESEEYALDASAPLADGVDVRLSSLTSIEAKAAIPGEIGGPGVQAVVEVTNSSSETVDLSRISIDLTDADGVSAGQVTTDPARPLMGSLEPGASASGTFVFVVPADQRADARFVLSYVAGQPQIVLAGDLPDA